MNWVKKIFGDGIKVYPVRNSSGALNPALRGGTPYGAEPGIILKCNSAAAAGPEGLPPGHEPFRGGAWPGGSSGALYLTGSTMSFLSKVNINEF
jgi:hypothetical protein